jgi:hypothetical protein
MGEHRAAHVCALFFDIVEPVHTQAIGLVLSDREPLSPMSGALLSSVANADFENELNRV